MLIYNMKLVYNRYSLSQQIDYCKFTCYLLIIKIHFSNFTTTQAHSINYSILVGFEY